MSAQLNKTSLSSIEDVIDDMRQGKMVILMDDENRENEGDLIMVAELCSAEHINFMASHGKGLICMPMSKERCERLGLSLMVDQNNSGFGTKFTVSIEAAVGVTTGISAADRATTVLAAAAKNAEAKDIVQPGHIFPLIAEPGGVLNRTGHTEAACDLAVLAGFESAGVICEIMNEDGTMARRDDLEIFAKKHDLKISTIAELIHYKIANEQTVDVIDKGMINTDHGKFELWSFRNNIDNEMHFALVKGDITPDEPTLVRVHLATTIRDLFSAQPADKNTWNVNRCLQKIAEEGKGVLALISRDESSAEKEQSAQFVLGKKEKPPVYGEGSNNNIHKTVGVGAQVLRHIGLGQIRVMGEAPLQYQAISGYDLKVIGHLPCE